MTLAWSTCHGKLHLISRIARNILFWQANVYCADWNDGCCAEGRMNAANYFQWHLSGIM